jgi:acyl-coenzyme A thioesterase PaaI-like protein
MEVGPHIADTRGDANFGALAMLADVALGVAIRSQLAPESRLATVALHLQVTGAPARGLLEARATFESFLEEAAGRQGLARVRVKSGDALVAFGSGAFMTLPPPPGVELHPVVQERPDVPLAEGDLEPRERELLAHADGALARAAGDHAFIDHFWGTVARATEAGADCTTPNGMQVANRVGHVQGGLLVGLAAATASAALGPPWRLSSISAWFVSPGEGATLETRSTIEHRGRLTGVVRSRVSGEAGRRVLESVSSHALK